jgi:hypothetical protein
VLCFPINNHIRTQSLPLPVLTRENHPGPTGPPLLGKEGSFRKVLTQPLNGVAMLKISIKLDNIVVRFYIELTITIDKTMLNQYTSTLGP